MAYFVIGLVITVVSFVATAGYLFVYVPENLEDEESR